MKPRKPKLFLGMESSNLNEFVSPCCRCGLSLEPLCKICCGCCGKHVSEKKAIWVGK